MGNAAFALEEISRPEVKSTKSALLGTTLRLGDPDNHPEESVEIQVKVSKCTALARPKTWKKFAVRRKQEDPEDVVMKEPDDDEEERKLLYAQLAMRTKYTVDHGDESEFAEDDQEQGQESKSHDEPKEEIEKEELIRGYKYGSSYAPCPDGNFPKLNTRKGIEICGFLLSKNFRHDWAMGEVQYIWADPGQPLQQVALSSIVEAMYEKGSMAIARWVSKDGADPKMGILAPEVFDNADCFKWVQVFVPLRQLSTTNIHQDDSCLSPMTFGSTHLLHWNDSLTRREKLSPLILTYLLTHNWRRWRTLSTRWI